MNFSDELMLSFINRLMKNEAYLQTILYEIADLRAAVENKPVNEIRDYQEETFEGLFNLISDSFCRGMD